MTTTPDTTDIEAIGYANSHGVVRLSAKRFEQSPYSARYVTDETLFGLYANRFYPLSVGGDAVKDYWQLRRGVILYDVPEKPLEIKGADAVTLLERVFSRKVRRLKTFRARYAIACTPQGTVLMDGVLIRLAKDHFWYVHANGEFESWLLAYSEGLDVTISDPHSWVLQIQGPKSLDVLNIATNGQASDRFGYFHAGMFNFAGQELLVTRTGWTGEMGFEVYSNRQTNHLALWDHLMKSGRAHNIVFGSLESMGIRRIEAGILDYGTDIDRHMTPFAAGLGAFVDLSKPNFVGRAALQKASQTCLLFGFVCRSSTPSAELNVLDNRNVVGYITTGGWSPTLKKGIGYVRFYASAKDNKSWLGRTLTLQDAEGQHHIGEVVSLPFYDAEKKIPRGLT